MKLTLVNFRCHLRQTYYFAENKISLLKGEPGNGKTTILNAIWWVLYGNMRGIGHLMSSGSQTVVTLEIDYLPTLGRNIIIRRQNHPNKFTLHIKISIDSNQPVKHEGDVAQQLIYQTFGTKDTWKAVSYIIQGEQCRLLTGSKQERLTLLEELSFHQDSPKEAIIKIDNQLRIERENFKIAEATFSNECQRLSQELATKTIPSDSSPEKIDQLKNELVKLQEGQILEQQREAKRNEYSGLINHLQTEIAETRKSKNFNILESEIQEKLVYYQGEKSKAETSLERLRNLIAQIKVSEGEIYQKISQELQTAIRERESHSKFIQGLEGDILRLNQNHQQEKFQETTLQTEKVTYQQNLTTLKGGIQSDEVQLAPLPIDGGWPTLVEVGQLRQIETNRSMNQKKAESLNLHYDQNILNEIHAAEAKLQDEERRQLQAKGISQILNLYDGIVNLMAGMKFPLGNSNQVPENYTQMEIFGKELRTEMIQTQQILEDKKSASRLLSCPKCGQSLSVQDGNLTSDPRPPSSPTEIEELQKKLSQFSQLEGKIPSLLASWKYFPEMSVVQLKSNYQQIFTNNIQDLRERTAILRQIQWIPEQNLSSDRCQRLVTLHSKYQDRDQFEKRLQEIVNDIQEKSAYLSKISEEIATKEKEKENLTTNFLRPLDQQILKLQKEKNEAQGKLQLADKEREIEVIKISLQKIQGEESRLQDALSQKRFLQQQLTIKETKLVEISENYKQLGSSLLSHYQKEIETKNSDLVATEQGIRIREWQKKLAVDRDKLIENQKSLASLEEFRKAAERVEYQRLKETISSINITMNTIFQSIFDEDIRVELQLFKKLKTNNRTKPQVNCLIHYKGACYDQPSLLCGGEKNRLNLGMILALNLVSPSPIILLDECTCFLNNRLRIKSLEVVRQMITGCKTIICVAHEDNEASYDHIIPIEPAYSEHTYFPESSQGEIRGFPDENDTNPETMADTHENVNQPIEKNDSSLVNNDRLIGNKSSNGLKLIISN